MTTAYADPEDQIAAEIAAMEAKGLDPYADRAPAEQAEPAPEAVTEPEATEDAADEAADEAPATVETTATAEQKTEPTAEAWDKDALAEIANPTSHAPQTYRAEVPADLAAKRTELTTAKAEALEKLMSGEIDAKEYAAEESRVAAELENLTLARARAETLAEVNRQTTESYQGNVIRALVARTKNEINYLADPGSQQKFDTALKLVAMEPEYAGKDFAEIADEAHRIVMARAGKVATKALAGPKPAPDRTPPTPPVTLSGLPIAAASGTKSVTEVVGRLSGDDLEKAMDSLNDVELRKLMKG